MKYLIIFLMLPFNIFSQTISSVAGNGTNGYSGDGGQATNAQFGGVQAIAIDSSNNLFFSDYQYNVIRRIDAITGVITTIAGIGTAGFSGDGGPATLAEFNDPNYLALDHLGNLYITDYHNYRVRKIDTSGIITTYAGSGSSSYSGDGGAATLAGFDGMRGIATDDSNNVYVGDVLIGIIRKIDHSTGIISTVAGNGISGFSGDGGPATLAELNQIHDIYIDNSDNIYAAEWGDDRVRKITTATGIISTVGGCGSCSTSTDSIPATDEFIQPYAIAVDLANNIYVSDFGPHRIKKINTITDTITNFAGNGTYGFTGDGGPAISAEIEGPCHISFDNCGNLYFPDCYAQRIRKITIPPTAPTICLLYTSPSPRDS